MKVKVDSEKCQGHNRCYALAPGLFKVDELGYATERGDGTVAPDMIEKAKLAVENCPERAIYLIEGSLITKEARTVRENVECPSLSPDNTRLAFKKRVSNAPGPVVWRLYSLDLATGVETRLAETRNVDDQVEWLDNQT